MPRAISAFFNIIVIFLTIFSAFIFYSENSENFKTKIILLIQSEIKRTLNVDASIKSLNVKWIGFEPIVQMKNVNISDEQDRIFLEVPNSLIHINAFDSFQNQTTQN